MGRLMALVPITVFVAVSAGLGLSLSLNDPRKLPSMLIDKPTPAFRLASLDAPGSSLSNNDLKGRVALLNVFASWCPGCRMEHPMLVALAEKSQIPIYGVSWKDPGGSRWLQANRSPYVRVGDDASGRLGIDLGVTGVPETFVIDLGGRIRYRYAGPINDSVWQESFAPVLAELRSEPQ